VGRIEQRFLTEGWHAVTVDGRDHDLLEKSLAHREVGRPQVVIAEVDER
jgi:transketolase